MLSAKILRNRDRFVVPGMEAVTFYSRNPTPSNPDASTPYSVPRAKRRPLSIKEKSQASMIAEVSEQVWEMWQESLDAAGAPAPKKDDWVIDSANVKWVFNTGEHKLFGDVWTMLSRQGV